MTGGESKIGGSGLNPSEVLEQIIERTKGNPRQREEDIKKLQELLRARSRGREVIKVAA
ncbi:hypothetical protein FWC63_03475 [Candidatus Saccharibacteria bacterium]|nr:hypothetical protein [Candidatus Saccharibacteria bacterium]